MRPSSSILKSKDSWNINIRQPLPLSKIQNLFTMPCFVFVFFFKRVWITDIVNINSLIKCEICAKKIRQAKMQWLKTGLVSFSNEHDLRIHMFCIFAYIYFIYIGIPPNIFRYTLITNTVLTFMPLSNSSLLMVLLPSLSKSLKRSISL